MSTVVTKKAAMSRIGSFKRKWDDENDQDDEITEIDWPASQPSEPPKKKLSLGPADEEDLTPAQRRLRAIQAALAETQVQTPPSAASSSASSSRTLVSKALSSSTVSKSGRVLPWEQDHESLKAQKARNKASTTTSSIKATNDTEPIAEIFLSQEQQYVLNQAKEGKNVFFTGSAGTGKSLLLRSIIRALREKHSKSADAVAITASTGIAACTIGGVTLHAFCGAGICAEPANELVAKIRKNKKSATRWLRTKVLIIDEVSMVDGDFFEKLAKIATLLRHNGKPFGGIQLVVTGDFFQLPPVVRGSNPIFAFETEAWKECIDVTINLTQVFRQKDQTFVDMLNRMRMGIMLDSDTEQFRRLRRVPQLPDGMEMTELFPRREDVERSNKTRMNQLQNSRHEFLAHDGGQVDDPKQREKLLANFMAPQRLELCIDSHVMLIKNTDDTLVNGSMGQIIGFCDPAEFRGVNQLTGEIERIEEIFDPDTKEGRKAMERKKKLVEEGKIEECPVVRFKIPGRDAYQHVLVTRETFKMELPNGDIQVSRSQLPLILAWAMSIHKSQGQTLDFVKVDLGRVFEKGQAYVALSRATSLQGLQVLNFDPKKVQAHPKVITWYRQLPTYSTLTNRS